MAVFIQWKHIQYKMQNNEAGGNNNIMMYVIKMEKEGTICKGKRRSILRKWPVGRYHRSSNWSDNVI